MINLYLKSGTLKGHSVITLILKSQKHKWTKAFKIKSDLPENSYTKSITLDAIGTLYGLRHIKEKYKKKKVTIYTDSSHVHLALKTKGDKYINKTRIKSINNLRDFIGTFGNISIKKFFDKCEYKNELEHIFIECALDNIEIDEKD